MDLFKNSAIKISAVVVAWTVFILIANGYHNSIPIEVIRDNMTIRKLLTDFTKLYRISGPFPIKLYSIYHNGRCLGLLTNGFVFQYCNILPIPGGNDEIIIDENTMVVSMKYRKLTDPDFVIRSCDFDIPIYKSTIMNNMLNMKLIR